MKLAIFDLVLHPGSLAPLACNSVCKLQSLDSYHIVNMSLFKSHQRLKEEKHGEFPFY